MPRSPARPRVAPGAALISLWLISGCAGERPIAPDEAEGLRLCRYNIEHPNAAPLTDAEIQDLLDRNVGPDGQADGIAAGVVDERGPRVLCAGTVGGPSGKKVDGDTIFEIGSITKVFTAILLQDMIDRGEMALDDAVQKYLPPPAKVPTFGGKEITLFHLATHTSGLPRDYETGSPAAPTPGELYAFLASCRLEREPGSRKEYSNLGVGLLGHAIALRAGAGYEELVVDRICRPLGIDSTRVTLTPELASRAARGHAFPGRPLASSRRFGALAGCGALCSTANDLLKFLAANLGLTDSPVTPLLARAHTVHSSAGRQDRLVWQGDSHALGHGGDIGGFRSDLGFDLALRRGVVLLANCRGSRIRANFKPILDGHTFRPARIAEIDGALLDDYVGTYRDGDRSACVVRRQGDRLTFQWWLGGPWLSLPQVRGQWFPQSRTIFFSRFWNDPAIFIRDDRGRVTGLLVSTATWTKVAGEPPEPPGPPDPAAFDGRCGQYRAKLFWLFPVGPTLNVYREDNDLGAHLMAYVPDLPGENRIELFPATEDTVITPALDGSWVTFRQEGTGKATGVLLHVNSKDIRGWRISDDPVYPPDHEGGRR